MTPLSKFYTQVWQGFAGKVLHVRGTDGDFYFDLPGPEVGESANGVSRIGGAFWVEFPSLLLSSRSFELQSWENGMQPSM